MMKHKSFYLYQAADILFTSSCRAIGILLAWIMIHYYYLKVELGWFITLSWLSQVFVLILMGLFSDKFGKKTIPIFCSFISFICLIFLEFGGDVEAIKLGCVYIITSILCIAIQPIGSSIVPNLYQSENLEKAFRIRGFVNSINTVLGAITSGFIINFFTTEETVRILTITIGISLMLFILIKTKKSEISQINHNSASAIKALINNKVERILVVVSALSNFVFIPTLMYITPILIIEKYQHTAFELGLSEATFGIGMLVGSIFLCQRLNNIIGVRKTTILSICIIAIGLLSILVLNNIFALFLGLFISGIGVVVYNINTTKIRCSATPSYLRNSFESTFLAICILPIPIGLSVSTLMVESGNLELALAMFSLLIFSAAVVVWRSKDFIAVSKLDDSHLEGYYAKLYSKAYPTQN